MYTLVDPLLHLERALSAYEVPTEFALQPDILNGAAFGYISYDCVRYFESKVDQYQQPDVFNIPESLFMFTASFAIFEHTLKRAKLVVLCPLTDQIDSDYALAVERLGELALRLQASDPGVYNTSTPSYVFSKLSCCF